MKNEYLYLYLALFSYLGIVEPILEKILKKEIILEHFWIRSIKNLSRKQQKLYWVASYLNAVFLMAILLYLNGA